MAVRESGDARERSFVPGGTIDLLLLSRLIYEARRVQFVRDRGGELPSPDRANNLLGIKANAICFVSFTQGSGVLGNL